VRGPGIEERRNSRRGYLIQVTYIRVKLSEFHLIFLKFFLKSNYTDYTDYTPRSHKSN